MENIQIVEITPEHAQELLKKNTNNRKMSKHMVKYYRDQLLNDEWQFNGQTISIAKDGTILDGQHRLASIALSGRTMKTILVTGLDNKVFKTIDTGKKRSAADVLYIDGVKKYTNIKAAGMRIVMGFLEGKDTKLLKSSRYTNTQLLDAYNAMPEFNNEVDACMKFHTANKLMPGSASPAFYYLFGLNHPEKRDEFYNQLDTGLIIQPLSPVLALREKLINFKHGDVCLQHERYNYIIAGWNAYIEGRQVKYLRPKDSYKLEDIK